MEIRGLHGRTLAEEYDHLANVVEKAHEVGEHEPNATFTSVYTPMWKQMIVIALRAMAKTV